MTTQNTPKTYQNLPIKLLLVTLSMAGILSACDKPPKPVTVEPAPSVPEVAAPERKAIVIVRPTEGDYSDDVMQWMNMASDKSPSQIAKDKAQEKEAKLKDDKAALAAATAASTKNAAALTSGTNNTTNASAETAKHLSPNSSKSSDVNTVTTSGAMANKLATSLAPMPASDQVVLKVLSSVQPKYPDSAIRADITEGKVTARIQIEPDGRVSKVEILKATPARYFDKEVIAAASQWKYAPISQQHTATLDFNFKLAN